MQNGSKDSEIINTPSIEVNINISDYKKINSIISRKGGLMALKEKSGVDIRTIKKYMRERKGVFSKLKTIKEAALELSTIKL